MLQTETTGRARFTKEERRRILRENQVVCANCGRPLTERDMTIEHVIPVSRGGTNADENLCCLCQACNREKRDLFYLPQGYYLAIRETARYRKIEAHVREWYQSLPEGQKCDLVRYPLISIAQMFYLTVNGDGQAGSFKGHRKKAVQNYLGARLEWRLAGDAYRSRAEALAGLTAKEMRAHICGGMTDPKEPPRAGIYVLHKISTGKLMAVAAVRYFEERKFLKIWVPWTDMSRYGMAQSTRILAWMALVSICYYGEKPVYQYSVESPMKACLDAFLDDAPKDPFLGSGAAYGCKEDLSSHIVVVDRSPRGITYSKSGKK